MRPASLPAVVMLAVALAAGLPGCGVDNEPAAGGGAGGPPPSALAPDTGETRSRNGQGTSAVPGRARSPGAAHPIVYHVVKGARFFDILVARIGNREHVVLGETDDMCLDLPDQRDFDGDGNRDALVFRSPACRGDAAPGLLFFVSGDTAFRRSNPFPGHRPRVEQWNGGWSVVAGETRHVLRDGHAVPVDDMGSEGPRGQAPGQSRVDGSPRSAAVR